LHTDKPVN